MAGAARDSLRFLRSHPWWTGLTALVLLVFGGWWAREEWAARRLVAEIAEWRASRAGVDAEEPPPDGENAAAGWFEALQVLSSNAGGSLAFSWETDAIEDLEKEVKANEGALALLDASLERPRCVLPARNTVAGSFWSLGALSLARGRVQAAAGERSAALRSFLVVHRMRRLLGGRGTAVLHIPSWMVMNTMDPLLGFIEGGDLGEEDLVFLLRHALRPEELRESEMDFYEGALLPMVAEGMERVVQPGGKEWLRSIGLKEPTLEQRMLRTFGKAYPPGVEEFPTAVQARTVWLLHREAAGAFRRRGAGAFPVVEEGPDSRDSSPDPFVEVESSLRDQVRYAFAAETWLSLLRGAAAARLHQVRSGSLPARMENLVPIPLDAPPEDPFTGGTLVWTMEGGAGVLRSAGPPKEDRGGGLSPLADHTEFRISLR